MSITTYSKTERSPRTGALISRTTILILGGVLIGMACGRLISHPSNMICLFSGVASFVAFLGLEMAAEKRGE